MIVWLNGRFVPEERAVVSVFDRGFLYGDGLFETIRVLHGRPFRWRQHFERLEAGAAFLGISRAHLQQDLRAAAEELIGRNDATDAILRLAISRGVGPRGYSPRGANQPTVVMSVHPRPPGQARQLAQWRLVLAPVRLPADEPLARYKTANKLAQIIARSYADTVPADEALLLNTRGFVIEGSASNLFWVEEGRVCTPPLSAGILPGVTRAVVQELCAAEAVEFAEADILPPALIKTEGVFLSLTSMGIVEASSLDGRSLRSASVVQRLHTAYCRLLEAETSTKRRT